MIDALIFFVRSAVAALLIVFGMGAAFLGTRSDEDETPWATAAEIRDRMRTTEPPPLRNRRN